MINSINLFFLRCKKSFIIIFALLTAFILGLIDYLIGIELSFSVFYLLPIFFASWYGGRGIGISFAFIGSIIWFFADKLAGHEYSNLLIPIWNSLIKFGFFFITCDFLSKIRIHLQNEENLADTDFLTGLKNSRYFYETIDNEIKRLKRYKRFFTIIYIDIDNFKTVNDTLGHNEGDLLLKSVGDILQSLTRESDTIARIGGDEFAGLFPETSKENAPFLVKKIFTGLVENKEVNNWIVGFSIGAVTFEKEMDNISDMIKYADNLMYKVKKQGKNNYLYEVYS